MIVGYDHIFLVAMRGSKTSKHRVTERDAKGKPGYVQFSGNFPTADPDKTYSTLVLDDEKWTEWFGKRQKLPGFETCEEAAETLVSTDSGIFFGCPLCAYATKSLEESKVHISGHVDSFMKQFTFEE